MPRVKRIEKARKSPGECGKCGVQIWEGEPYLKWAFRFGGRHIRCGKPACAPTRSDLTRSEFWSAVFSLQDTVWESEDLESQRDDVVGELENIKSETEDKLSNMPDGLQQGSTGELLQERIDALDDCINELGSVDCDIEDYADESDPDEAKEQRIEEIKQEMSDTLGNISCG